MKQILFACACTAVFALALSSCKKDDDKVSMKVKSVIYSNAPNTRLDYTYDSEGRVSTIQSVYIPTNTNGRKSVYSYTDTTVTESICDSGCTTSSNYVYPLNSEGLITGNASGTTTYEYDGEGHLVRYANTAADLVNTYDWVDGDRVKLTLTFSTLPPDTQITFLTYFTDRLETRDFGSSFNGLDNKNLVAAWTNPYNSGIVTASYEYDAEGRVTKEIRHLAATVIPIATYTYY